MAAARYADTTSPVVRSVMRRHCAQGLTQKIAPDRYRIASPQAFTWRTPTWGMKPSSARKSAPTSR